MSVSKTIDLVGVSTQSWREAAQAALQEAAKTLRGIEGMEVLETSAVVEVSNTSIPSMPRSVFAASWSAAWAASRHDCVDTPTRSMVLLTDIRTPCAPDYLRDCRRHGRRR